MLTSFTNLTVPDEVLPPVRGVSSLADMVLSLGFGISVLQCCEIEAVHQKIANLARKVRILSSDNQLIQCCIYNYTYYVLLHKIFFFRQKSPEDTHYDE